MKTIKYILVLNCLWLIPFICFFGCDKNNDDTKALRLNVKMGPSISTEIYQEATAICVWINNKSYPCSFYNKHLELDIPADNFDFENTIIKVEYKNSFGNVIYYGETIGNVTKYEDNEINVTVYPVTLTLNPKSGFYDTEVTAVGTNFAKNEKVYIRIDNINVRETQTDAQGNFNVKFNIKSDKSGDENIQAIGASSNRMSKATFSVTPTPTKLPDLIIRDFRIEREEIEYIRDGFVKIPFSVAIGNIGQSKSGGFSVSIKNRDDLSSIIKNFYIQDLAEGSQTSYDGNLSFELQEDPTSMDLIAIVDDCSGNNICGVQESNENNNTSNNYFVVNLPSKLPDLVITEFKVTGEIIGVNDPGNIAPFLTYYVPVRVVVKNQGYSKANIFKVSAHYSIVGDGFENMIHFTVPGEADTWCPYTKTSLASDDKVTFDGNLVIYAVANTVISTFTLADSCAAEENQPNYCKIREFNENNNKSNYISLTLKTDLVIILR